MCSWICDQRFQKRDLSNDGTFSPKACGAEPSVPLGDGTAGAQRLRNDSGITALRNFFCVRAGPFGLSSSFTMCSESCGAVILAAPKLWRG